MAIFSSETRISGAGTGGATAPPQYLADQLTLFELERADYLHILLLTPSMFFTEYELLTVVRRISKHCFLTFIAS